MSTAQATTYTIDPVHSNVDFSIRHLMIAKVRGTFRTVTGTLELGPGDIPTAVSATIAVESLDTRDPGRDAHVKSPDFLDVATFPEITFTSTSIAGSGTSFTIAGDLTIHGVTKPVELEAEFNGRVVDPWGNDRVGYEARTKIDREAFGVTFNAPLETGGVMLGKDLTIELQIEAIAPRT